MADLNLDLNYFTHPKTIRLIGLLGRGAEVLPIRLWCYCGKYHAESGRLAGYSVQEVESILEWWGEKGKAVEAMVSVGFLHEDGKNSEKILSIHEWKNHQGHIVFFKKRAKIAAKARWSKEVMGNATSSATSSAIGGGKQCPLPPPPNQHSVAKPPPPPIPSMSPGNGGGGLAIAQPVGGGGFSENTKLDLRKYGVTKRDLEAEGLPEEAVKKGVRWFRENYTKPGINGNPGVLVNKCLEFAQKSGWEPRMIGQLLVTQPKQRT
ncbi:MAG: hypothetical protein A3D89_04255 [Planctomycetes bacterium RIFCSPHIGHO2_02_FULL_52_58]|nr:MAG: hypothetical protein A3D89_04255 [Planctomycetes bacterium RIFCSPHIGHO2_02_FULL_52_58]